MENVIIQFLTYKYYLYSESRYFFIIVYIGEEKEKGLIIKWYNVKKK